MNYIYAIWRWKKQYRCFEIIAQRFQQKHVNYNLVFFRDEIEIFIISLFETRSRFVPSISRASRRDRDLYLLYLVLRDEIENLLYQILNFEKGTRNKKGFLVIEREFLLLNLTRFFEIQNSRVCLASCKRKRILSGLLDMTMKPGDTAGLWFPVKCGIFSIWSDWVMIQQIMGEHRQ